MNLNCETSSPLYEGSDEEIRALRSSIADLGKRVLSLERILRIAIDVSEDIVIEVQPQTGSLSLDSSKLFRLYGIPMSCLTLNNFMEHLYGRIHPDDKRRFLSDFQVMSDGSFPMNMRSKTEQYRFLEAENRHCPLQITISSYFGDAEDGVFYIIMKNASGLRSLSDSHNFMAEQDSLTGAYNLGALKERVSEYLAYRKAEGILVFFRITNINLIPETMDARSEREAAAELMRLLRRGIRQDDYIARTETGEYIVFITGNRSRQATERSVFEVRKSFGMFLLEKNMPAEIKVTAGIAVAPRDGMDFDSLISAAEKSIAPV